MTAGNTVPTNTVYQCASVVTSVLSSGKDYAVFQLDRAVPASVATPARQLRHRFGPVSRISQIKPPPRPPPCDPLYLAFVLIESADRICNLRPNYGH